MTDTQKRIQAYQSMLPRLKERVMAVAMLLVMSFAMMTSASFAWLTISRAPEVSGVKTNVAANGNLEIALATGDGSTAPNPSQVGDSSAAEDQSVPDANVTWGNLINLSDPSYGLENLTMRPAQLNKSDLLGSPLYGAVYSVDGRIEKLSSNFSYTQWVPPVGTTPGYFGMSTGLGVRAISSTKVKAVGVWEGIISKRDEVTGIYTAAGGKYIELTQNDAYMQSLAYIMGVFMTDRLNATQGDESLTNPTVNKTHLGNLVLMYDAFVKVFEEEARGMVALVNLQQHIKYSGKTEEYTDYTVQSLLTTSESALTAKGLKLEGLDRFKQDYTLLQSDLEILTKINSSGTVKWRGTQVKDDGTVVTVGETDEEKVGRSLKAVVNSLVNLNTCTLDGTNIQNIGASNAMGYLEKSCQAVITNGVLYEFEKRTGINMLVGNQYNNGKGLKLEATVKRSIIKQDGTIYAIITTSAPTPSLFNKNLNYALNMSTEGFKGEITAEDTYGMAIDLWVRTNAAGSYLTLEGNVLTRTEEKPVKDRDSNGKEVDLYAISREEEVTIEETDPESGETTAKTETVVVNYSLYKVVGSDAAGKETTTWYRATLHEVFELKDGETPLPKMEQVEIILGYEGENRVWGEDELMSTDATTQGAGSCYVYYADTPEDQARSLKLLESFKVAFVDGAGNLLATAVMDTQRFYAESGRVTVPLKLSPTDSIELGEDYQGVTQYAIMPLQQDVATRITAIVYLDGTTLTNDQVLSAADIQGQMNIQFGSSISLQPIDNETLANKELHVSASVDKTKFDYDTHVGDMISTVTVHVVGDEPSTVKGFFLRQISATQGSREEEMTFEKNADGDWVATHKFTAPGKYVLRSVELDGISRDLPVTPQVEISGFAIESLSCTEAVENYITILAAENYGTVNLSLRFATDDPTKMPTTVQGRFLHDEDGSAVNINFTYDATSGLWTGSATFLTSGDYTMEYLVLNGEYEELPATMILKADVTLGMRVAVWTNSPTQFKYLGDQMPDNQKNLSMLVKIMDNSGEEMPGLSGAKLTYRGRGQNRAMDTDLTWNSTSGYYEGELAAIGAGIWEFAQVIVSGNTLTTVTTAPTFTMIPPEPPAYDSFMPAEYQYAPNGDAKMNVALSNATTATIEAVVKNTTTGKSYTVLGNLAATAPNEDGVSVSTFNFILPKDTVLGHTEVQDGHWTMEEIHVRGYFNAAGDYISADKDENGDYVDEPLTINMRDKNYSTKVVQTVTVVLPEGTSKNFGKDSSGNVTGTFMQSHKVSGLSVVIRDFENKQLEGIKDVKLTFTYVGGSSETNGGYTSTGLTSATDGATVTVLLTADGDSTNYLQRADAALVYAGNYTTTFSYTMGTQVVTLAGETLPENAPVYTVWSKTPTVKITSAYYKSGDKDDTAASSITNNNTATTVYHAMSQTEICNVGLTTNYNSAYVTITLSGYGRASGATLTFNTNNSDKVVHLYPSGQQHKGDSGTKTNAYQWTKDGDCLRYVGWVQQNDNATDDKKAAGTLTATELVMTYGGVAYSVTLPTAITINNPS